MNKPEISVFMPVFNSENYLKLSIESILGQTFENFEFIIVNDGSDDSSSEIIDTYKRYDKRILVIENQKNQGLAKSLNLAFNYAKGKYIARMDSDDISELKRFDLQKSFLENNPKIGFVGSSGFYIDEKGEILGIYSVPLSDLEIKWQSLFSSPFIHPSIMMKKTIFLKNNILYDENFSFAQDYDLWTRLLPITKAENLEEPLINYRVFRSHIDILKIKQQKSFSTNISLRNIRKNFPDFAETDDFLLRLIDLMNNENSLYPLDNFSVDYFKGLIHLFNKFIESHDAHSNLQIKRKFTTKMSRKLLRLPLPIGFFSVINELKKINKFWYFDYLITIPSSIRQRITHNKIST